MNTATTTLTRSRTNIEPDIMVIKLGKESYLLDRRSRLYTILGTRFIGWYDMINKTIVQKDPFRRTS